MSLQTWKWASETLSLAALSAAQESWEVAIKHSLQKWTCLDPSVLATHEVVKQGRVVRDLRSLQFVPIDPSTCALCIRAGDGDCSQCIGKRANGYACTAGTRPYLQWVETGDHRSMIAWLETALEYARGDKLV